jgi:gamma-glutamyltranspeptidase / glutathione hydrolase
MVASAHYLASQAGVWMLRQRGNAVDAAVCTAATIAVVAPHLNGVGGDLFAQVWRPGDHTPIALNASGRSGSHATIEHVRALGYDSIPVRGPLTINVPGAVSGWQALLERFGTRRLVDVLEPAIDYAEHGAPVTSKIAAALQTSRELIEGDAGFQMVFTRDGRLLREGEAFVNRDLASSLREIGRTDGEAIYRGALGRRLGEELRKAGAMIEVSDLEAHHADWVEPIQTDVLGRRIFELPPNTQGATALELLNMAEALGVTALGHNSAQYIHELTRAMRLAYADRDQFITDPDFADIPLTRLISKHHAREGLRHYSSSSSISDRGDTIYLCCVDENGMGVSLIQSQYMGFGSGVMANGTGIHLQNRGTYFSLDPSHVNRLEPHKRTMHTLIPALALADGRLDVVFGTMGGDAQPQIHLQILLNHLGFGMDLQEAVEAPRFVFAPAPSIPNRLLIEARFSPDVIAELRSHGFEVTIVDEWSSQMGHAQAIRIDAARAMLVGAADPRGDGAALGH